MCNIIICNICSVIYNIWSVKFKCAIISLVLQFITTGLELIAKSSLSFTVNK